MMKPIIYRAEGKKDPKRRVIYHQDRTISVNPQLLPFGSEQKDVRFHIIMDFGNHLKHLQKSVSPKDRIRVSQPNLEILSFTNKKIAFEMAKISQIANDTHKSPQNLADREKYRQHLSFVYRQLAYKLKEKIGNKKTMIFAPRNGGIFLKEVAKKILQGKNVSWFGYRMSRIQKADGGLMVGIQLDKNNPELKGFDTFIFFDDCMASYISCAATMEMIKSNLKPKTKDPASGEVFIAVSAGIQRSLQEIISEKTRKYFGFKNISALTGILVFAMNDRYYLVNIEKNPGDAGKIVKYTVGDMGNWTKSSYQEDLNTLRKAS